MLEQAISLQLYQVSAALILGVAAGVFYDVLKIWRRRIRRKGVTGFIDSLFWILLIPVLFTQTMVVGGGGVRMFMLLSNFVGSALYFLVFSAPVRFLLDKLVDILLRFGAFLTKPLRKIWSKGKKVWEKVKRGFQKLAEHDTIRANYRFRARKRRSLEQAGGEFDAEEKTGQHIYETGRIGTGHLRLSHPSRTPQPNRGRPSRKRRTGNHRGRTGKTKRNLRERD